MVSFENGIDSVIQSLSRIEGERWSKLQHDHKGYNVQTMYEAWQSYQVDMPDYCQENPDEIVDPALVNLPGEGAIYGEGGSNRYTVRISGEITASRHHASGHKIPLIEEQGIRLY